MIIDIEKPKEEMRMLLIKKYYEFYENLYGKEVVNLFDEYRPNFQKIKGLGKFDQNLKYAYNIVNDLYTNPNLHMVALKTNEGQLIAFSMIKDYYPERSIHVCDIIIMDDYHEDICDLIYSAFLEYYEGYVAKNVNVTLEIPWKNLLYQYEAEKYGFTDEDDDQKAVTKIYQRKLER